MPPFAFRMPPTTLVIERSDVETRNHEMVRTLLYHPMCAKAPGDLEGNLELLGFLTLAISGYDDDPREVWQVPEVRTWFAELEGWRPNICYYLSPGMVNLLFCATRIPYTEEDPGMYATGQQVAEFLKDTYYWLNRHMIAHQLEYENCKPFLNHCTAIAEAFDRERIPIQ